ncbi:MAG: hypothetical protein NVS2B16_31990 [Chloroflexota bacterium]
MLGLLATKRDFALPMVPPIPDWFNLLILDGIGYSSMIATRWKSSSNYGQKGTSVSGSSKHELIAKRAMLSFQVV